MEGSPEFCQAGPGSNDSSRRYNQRYTVVQSIQCNEARGVTLDSSWSDTWKSSASSTASEKWVYIFQKMKEKQSSTAELAMLLEFVLCIPGEPPNWCTYSSA